MKKINLFAVLLIAILGILSGCATSDVKADKPAKTAAKTKKAADTTTKAQAKSKAKKSAPKKKLTLEEETKIATTPVQHPSHVKRHAAKKKYAAANKDKIKVLMLGDSITHQWEGKAAAAANKKYLAPYNVLNLGCNGDRTYHTLWLVEKSGIPELIKPKVVTIMIGTNNRNDYRATAAGIKRIIDGVRKHYPEAKILLYAIFPRGKDSKNRLRINNDKVNAEIVKFCNGKDIIWVDIRKNYLTDKGILEKSMMPDYLHPRTSKGYSVWGESLKPYFDKYAK